MVRTPTTAEKSQPASPEPTKNFLPERRYRCAGIDYPASN
jgi:hypothetical protein